MAPESSVNRVPPSPADVMLGAEQSAPSLADERLEMAIEAAHQAFVGAVTRPMKLELQEQMKRLINARSPWMILHLEREKGLR